MDRFLAEFRGKLDGNRAVGHAAVFGPVAEIRGGLERLDPAVFTRALSEGQDVVALVNHEGLPLGRTSAGTLRLGVDADGLTYDNDLPDTQLGRDVRTLLDRGDLRAMSFGFIPRSHRIDQVEGRTVRTITDLDLFDVSIVTHPAYAGTDVALRHIREFTSSGATSVRAQAAMIRARIRTAK